MLPIIKLYILHQQKMKKVHRELLNPTIKKKIGWKKYFKSFFV